MAWLKITKLCPGLSYFSSFFGQFESLAFFENGGGGGGGYTKAVKQDKVLQGMWTSDETIVFAVLLKLLSKTSLKPSVENLLFLYNWTVGVVGTECGLKIRPKSRNQITGKLEYMKKLTSFHNS